MRIMSLDLASITGWAHTCGASGVWDLRHQRDESTGTRLIKLARRIVLVLESVGCDLIVYEQMSVMRGRNANANASQHIGKMIGIVEYVVESNDDVECKSFNNARIKAHAFRHARKGTSRDKAAIVAAAQRRWPELEVIDDNHADALWLLDLACEEYGVFPKPEFSGKEIRRDL